MRRAVIAAIFAMATMTVVMAAAAAEEDVGGEGIKERSNPGSGS